MQIEWDGEALNAFAEQISRATEDAYDTVVAEHAGDPIDTVRDALKAELAKRFEAGTGPDEILIQQMAQRIHEG